ncbi:hypothetical protein PUNSTDRAFT_97851 [Punctularia strigosozonata HHB-11173 SS5]|uniref:uncharacterized protein n=1 Tax=Punctularia strigosozonata (strain HHB-11173) TaxID=741275 RepID=UPI00044185FE|nr:uncharacterized protein PUNSTDRAFT_97851 [Punctularia strigosozonata HHB-11173 SS5]EIN12898.1 hypothetical protein PUNSTDRAFT_97851 [Punctularia strigosozonata HHB-11173 SS5]
MNGHDRVDANRLNRARAMTLGSWVINFACQMYGMLTSPNMKEVADDNHYAFSPNPWFIGAFFSMQTVLQLWWIYLLFKHSQETAGRLDALGYAPVYAIGNICIGTSTHSHLLLPLAHTLTAAWMIFWINQMFWPAQALVTINSFIQLWAMTRLPFITRLNLSTHLVAKTFAGIGVLDFLDNGAVALRYSGPPGQVVKAIVGVVFGIASLTQDPIFGACLVYDLLGMYVGQSGTWGATLMWMVVAIGAVVAVKTVVFRIF